MNKPDDVEVDLLLPAGIRDAEAVDSPRGSPDPRYGTRARVAAVVAVLGLAFVAGAVCWRGGAHAGSVSAVGGGTMWYSASKNYDNGDKYVGNMENGERSGKGTYYYKNGDKYEGEFKDDEKSGVGIYDYKNGDRYEGNFKNDFPSGQGIYFNENGGEHEMGIGDTSDSDNGSRPGTENKKTENDRQHGDEKEEAKKAEETKADGRHGIEKKEGTDDDEAKQDGRHGDKKVGAK